jgi:hypothetical protein
MFSEPKFKAYIKKLGITKYTLDKNKIIISSNERSPEVRKGHLLALQGFFTESTFVDDGRSGHLQVKEGRKIVLKVFSKPEKTAGGLILKPQFFSSITDEYIQFNDYAPKVIASIDDNKKLQTEQKEYLKTLVKYNVNPSPANTTSLKKTYKALKDCIPINTINNDFSEILGPIAVVNLGLLPIKKDEAYVFVPGRGNEPLLDYKIMTKEGNKTQVYKISAKSGDTINTLKPGDVLKLIEDEETLYTKFKKTTQFKVIEILATNSWKEGPIKAVNFLKSKRIKEAGWITSDKYTEPLRQQAENSLVNISKKDLDFTPLYEAATNLKVYYVKFRMGNEGIPVWEILKDNSNRPETKKRIEFRSKNYVGRPNGDKLGFQPK